MPTLDAFGIVVADMPGALAFYRRLGLSIPPEADGESHVEALLDGGVRLMLDTESLVRGFDPTYDVTPGRGRIGLAFRCADSTEVDRVYADLIAAGHPGHLPPWDAFWGQRYATVVDPDGNHVDLYAPLD